MAIGTPETKLPSSIKTLELERPTKSKKKKNFYENKVPNNDLLPWSIDIAVTNSDRGSKDDVSDNRYLASNAQLQLKKSMLRVYCVVQLFDYLEKKIICQLNRKEKKGFIYLILFNHLANALFKKTAFDLIYNSLKVSYKLILFLILCLSFDWAFLKEGPLSVGSFLYYFSTYLYNHNDDESRIRFKNQNLKNALSKPLQNGDEIDTFISSLDQEYVTKIYSDKFSAFTGSSSNLGLSIYGPAMELAHQTQLLYQTQRLRQDQLLRQAQKQKKQRKQGKQRNQGNRGNQDNQDNQYNKGKHGFERENPFPLNAQPFYSLNNDCLVKDLHYQYEQDVLALYSKSKNEELKKTWIQPLGYKKMVMLLRDQVEEITDDCTKSDQPLHLQRQSPGLVLCLSPSSPIQTDYRPFLADIRIIAQSLVFPLGLFIFIEMWLRLNHVSTSAINHIMDLIKSTFFKDVSSSGYKKLNIYFEHVRPFLLKQQEKKNLSTPIFYSKLTNRFKN
jgi:hypothetical protein